METNPYGWKRIGWAVDSAQKDMPKFKYSTSVLATIIWFRSLYRRVKRVGKSLIIQIDGEHQTGKSRFGGFFLAWLLDPTFEGNRKTRVCTTDVEILGAVKEIQSSGIKGAAIVIDEGGAAVGRQDYSSKISIAINKTVQIIGSLHPIIIVISPIKQQILTSLERMSHKYLHFERTGEGFSFLYPYNVRYNSLTKKLMTPKPIVNIFGNKYYLNRIKVFPIPKWMDDMYAEIEAEKKPPMFEKFREQAMESRVKEKRKDPLELVELVLEDWKEKGQKCIYLAKASMKEGSTYISFDPNRIKTRLGVSYRDADTIAIEARVKIREIQKEELK